MGGKRGQTWAIASSGPRVHLGTGRDARLGAGESIISARGGWRSRMLLTSATWFADVSILCGGRGAGGDRGAGSHRVCVGVSCEKSEWGPLFSPSPSHFLPPPQIPPRRIPTACFCTLVIL